jgi:hypothetical protein
MGGDELNVFFLAESGAAEDSLELSVHSSAGTLLGRVMSAGSDTSLEAQATGRFALDADGRHSVRVEGLRGAVDTGPYRFMMFPIDRAPEAGSPEIQLGQIVVATVDPVGDVDEFRFTTQSDRLITTVVFQGMSGRDDDHLTLTVQAQDQTGPRVTLAGRGTDPALETHYSGRFEAAPFTTYVVRVQGENSRDDAGPYRFRVSAIDPTPESRSPAFAVGDSVGESIDALGDIDEFTFSAPVGQYINLIAWAGPPPTLPPLVFTVERMLTGGVTGVRVPPDSTRGSGRTWLDGGSYRVRVNSPSYDDASARYKGEYAFWVVPIDTLPEHAPSTISIGDTIAVEDLEPAGDLDRFQFIGQAGQLVTAYLENLSSSSVSPFTLWVFGPVYVPPTYVWATYGASPLSTNRTRTTELPETGTYTVSVWGEEAGRAGSLDQRGPYRFHLRGISRGPEIAPASLVLGDTVDNETIFIEADVDEFLFSGSAGREFVVFFRGLVPPHRVDLTVVDSAAGSVLGSVVSLGLDPYVDDRVPPATGRFALPRDGEFMVRVVGSQQGGAGTPPTGYLGGYAFQVFPIDPGPEIAPSTVAVGDTVAVEVLHPMGDVDEFEFDGVAGDSITIGGEITGASIGPPILTDLTTGTLLWGPQPGWALQRWSQSVMLPSTGRYRLRYEEYVSELGYYNSEHDQPVPYRFWIVR